MYILSSLFFYVMFKNKSSKIPGLDMFLLDVTNSCILCDFTSWMEIITKVYEYGQMLFPLSFVYILNYSAVKIANINLPVLFFSKHGWQLPINKLKFYIFILQFINPEWNLIQKILSTPEFKKVAYIAPLLRLFYLDIIQIASNKSRVEKKTYYIKNGLALKNKKTVWC